MSATDHLARLAAIQAADRRDERMTGPEIADALEALARRVRRDAAPARRRGGMPGAETTATAARARESRLRHVKVDPCDNYLVSAAKFFLGRGATCDQLLHSGEPELAVLVASMSPVPDASVVAIVKGFQP